MKEVQENSKKMINSCKDSLANQSLKHEKDKKYLKVRIEAQYLQTMNQINQSQSFWIQEKDNAEIKMKQ
jgi:hypothetical protein